MLLLADFQVNGTSINQIQFIKAFGSRIGIAGSTLQMPFRVGGIFDLHPMLLESENWS